MNLDSSRTFPYQPADFNMACDFDSGGRAEEQLLREEEDSDASVGYAVARVGSTRQTFRRVPHLIGLGLLAAALLASVLAPESSNHLVAAGLLRDRSSAIEFNLLANIKAKLWPLFHRGQPAIPAGTMPAGPGTMPVGPGTVPVGPGTMPVVAPGQVPGVAPVAQVQSSQAVRTPQMNPTMGTSQGMAGQVPAVGTTGSVGGVGVDGGDVGAKVGPGPMCASKEDCLSIVDHYLDSCPRSFGLLQARGDGTAQGLGNWISLNGGSCGANCVLPAACPEGAAKCRHDTYDSAVAAIYYIKRGRLDKAKEILDTFLQALYPTSAANIQPTGKHTVYTGAASGHALTLLASSYNSATQPTAGNYQNPFVTDGGVDSGNNAWAALAFAHYAAAARAPCYATVARDILGSLVSAGSCSDTRAGYLGHLTPYEGNYRSAEHNIDIFALGKVLDDATVQQRAATFVKSMYGANPSYPSSYAMGTGSGRRCDTTVNGGAVPADATFWNLLADSDPDQQRMTSALQFAFQTPMRKADGKLDAHGLWVTDEDIITPDGGTRTSPVKVTGTRFTTFGNGVQWEVTASAVLALAHFQQQYGSGAAIGVPQHLKEARNSLRTLLAIYKGVPQSVLGGNYGAWKSGDQIGTQFPGGTETGLGWPYLRYLGTVTTAWTGLALLYQTDWSDPVNEDANPYAPPASPVPSGKDCSCLPPSNVNPATPV